MPVYDTYCAATLGHPDLTGECYHFFKFNAEQFQVEPDPAGTSDGIITVKVLAAPGTNPNPEPIPLEQGEALVITHADGSPETVLIRGAFMFHRIWENAGEAPQPGQPCGAYPSGSWLLVPGTDPSICICVDTVNGPVWGRAALQTSP